MQMELKTPQIGIEKWKMKHLVLNTINYTKLARIAESRNNATRIFFRQKLVRASSAKKLMNVKIYVISKKFVTLHLYRM